MLWRIRRLLPLGLHPQEVRLRRRAVPDLLARKPNCSLAAGLLDLI